MQIDIFDYGMNGEGVGKIDNKITLVNYAIVGEKVDANITNSFKNYDIAKISKILIQSPNRVTPPCPYFKVCGGCDLQHMAYGEQLKFKRDLVRKTIKKIAGIDVHVNPTVPSDSNYFYRNKTSFAVSRKIGLYKKQSNDIIAIDSCQISNESINKVLKIFKAYAKVCDISQIKNLVVRSIDGTTLVGVVAKQKLDLLPFYSMLEKQIENVGLYLFLNTRKDSVILTQNCTHIAGEKYIKTSLFDINYSVDLSGFHQTNINIQNKLYSKVVDLIKSYGLTNKVVVNGFSGEGLLSAMLAKCSSQVYGIEIEKSSHLSAENLKKTNKITNLTNILGDFNEKIKDLSPDVLVLDPSKKGIGKQTMQQINKINDIIYISCNPIALAKDLREILNNYIIEEITPFDMFPNTKNVETIVKLKFKGDNI